MAEIRPFRGLRYGAEAGSLHQLVAPPYDVLSPSERDGYSRRSPYNVVHLTLPEHRPDDRSKFIRYGRSAAALAEWRRDGILELEDKPAFYRYTQEFTVPYTDDVLRRTSVIALIKLEPYDKGVVLPHEQTFPKHKEDRLRILEATRSHLECIFGLFEDPDSQMLEALRQAPSDGRVEVTSDDHTHQILEPITDEETCRTLAALLADRKVWIADGHHRYETALAFRASQGDKDEPIAEDYMMMALSSMSDPGLVLLPTHRILTDLPMPVEECLEHLGTVFTLEEMHSSRLANTLAAIDSAGGRAFGMALPGGVAYILRPKDEGELVGIGEVEGSDDLRGLDVSILHSVILERLLRIRGLESIAYTRDSHEATRAVEEGAAAAFLMNPPTVDDMRRIALGGEKMPQKSTYYFPKILSGLVLWSLNDF